MLYYLKLLAVMLSIFLAVAAVQTAEHRFGTFENYLNVGYGNTPYTYNNK